MKSTRAMARAYQTVEKAVRDYFVMSAAGCFSAAALPQRILCSDGEDRDMNHDGADMVGVGYQSGDAAGRGVAAGHISLQRGHSAGGMRPSSRPAGEKACRSVPHCRARSTTASLKRRDYAPQAAAGPQVDEVSLLFSPAQPCTVLSVMAPQAIGRLRRNAKGGRCLIGSADTLQVPRQTGRERRPAARCYIPQNRGRRTAGYRFGPRPPRHRCRPPLPGLPWGNSSRLRRKAGPPSAAVRCLVPRGEAGVPPWPTGTWGVSRN